MLDLAEIEKISRLACKKPLRHPQQAIDPGDVDRDYVKPFSGISKRKKGFPLRNPENSTAYDYMMHFVLNTCVLEDFRDPNIQLWTSNILQMLKFKKFLPIPLAFEMTKAWWWTPIFLKRNSLQIPKVYVLFLNFSNTSFCLIPQVHQSLISTVNWKKDVGYGGFQSHGVPP